MSNPLYLADKLIPLCRYGGIGDLLCQEDGKRKRRVTIIVDLKKKNETRKDSGELRVEGCIFAGWESTFIFIKNESGKIFNLPHSEYIREAIRRYVERNPLKTF